jgi:hypothetical protein
MKVSISKDQWGIQLCAGEGNETRCLDLRHEYDLRDIKDAIEEYLDRDRGEAINFLEG